MSRTQTWCRACGHKMTTTKPWPPPDDTKPAVAAMPFCRPCLPYYTETKWIPASDPSNPRCNYPWCRGDLGSDPRTDGKEWFCSQKCKHARKKQMQRWDSRRDEFRLLFAKKPVG